MNVITKAVNFIDELLKPLADLAKDEDFKGEVLLSAGALQKASPADQAKTKEKLNKVLQLLDDLRKKLGLDKSDIPNVDNIVAFAVMLAELYKVFQALREMLESCDYFGLESEDNDTPSEDKEMAIVNAVNAISRFLTSNVLRKKAPVIAAFADAAGIFSDEYTEVKRALDLVLFPLFASISAIFGIEDGKLNDALRPVGDVKLDDHLRITKGIFLLLSILAKAFEGKIQSQGKFLFNFGYELPVDKDKFPLAANVAGRLMQMQFIPGARYNAKDDEWIGDELFGAAFRDTFISFATIPVFPPDASADTAPTGYQYLLGMDINPGDPTGSGDAEPGLTQGRFSVSFPANFAASLLWGEGIDGVKVLTQGPLATSGPVLVAKLAAAAPATSTTSPTTTTSTSSNGANSGDITFVMEPKKTNGKDDLEIRIEFKDFGLSLSGDDRDGFLQKILPDKGASIKASFSIVYSALLNKFSITGLDGNDGLLFLFAVNKKLFGALNIPNIYMGLKPYLDDQKEVRGITLESSAQMGLTLGPFSMSVDRLGLNSSLSFPAKADGNLGAANLSVGLKPPTGIGFLVKASVIQGGGFLSIDPDNNQYYGVGELTIKLSQNTPNEMGLSLKIVAVILTRMPDGSKGYSFLLLATIEFNPAFDTVFGFKLKGVGVLVAIHRTMNMDVFQDAVKDDRFNAILFPDNPVANAPGIVKTMNALFPPAEGRYVFAIMARIGWGTAKLVDIKVGLLVEVPSPVKLALVGVIKVTVEAASIQILRFQLNFLVALDLGKKIFSIDAAIYDSKFLKFDIRGQMFLRYRWGNDPVFLMSVGGWHPDFQVPAGLNLPQKADRLTVVILDSDHISLILSCYVAFTSNTVQAGFAIDFKLHWSKFRLESGLSVDALFHFDPFYFVVDFEGKLRIYWGSSQLAGITVKGKFSGTHPWRIEGKASFEIWIFSYDVDFDESSGDALSETSQETQVLPLIQKALQDKANWQATLPAGRGTDISLRNTTDDAKDEAAADESQLILADPLARLDVMQQVAPLGVRIDKLGFQKITDFHKLDLQAQTNDGQLLQTNALPDFFAPAMFLELADAEKLSRKSYESMKAGVSFGDSSSVTTGAAQVSDFEYDNAYYDPLGPSAKPAKPSVDETNFQRWIRNNSTGRSAQGRKAAAGREIDARKPLPKANVFVLADAVTGSRIAEVPAQDSMTAAYDEVWKLQNNNPLRKINVVRESDLIN